MRRTVEKILRRYGSPITLRRSVGDTLLYGMMQHTGSLSWQNMRVAYSPLGEVPKGQYLLILPVEPLLKRGDFLLRDGSWYWVRRVEKVMYRDEAIYCWCLCEKGGNVDHWGL